MLDRIKHFFRKKKSSASDRFVAYLRNKGVSVGNGVVFYNPVSTVVDTSYPELLSFGNNVRIAHGCIILTHDYSWSVIAGVYGELVGGIAPVTIGNNVFLGINTIILKGVKIGNNVIVGAGSVVTKDIPSNEVWAGNPAKRIMSLEDYYRKKTIQSKQELHLLINRFGDDYKKHIHLFREYSPLFKDFASDDVQKLAKDTGYLDLSEKFYSQKERPFSDIDELIEKWQYQSTFPDCEQPKLKK